MADAARGAATTDADAPERPAGRRFHSATYIGFGKMVVHGGRSADEVFRDVLVLDLETELWFLHPNLPARALLMFDADQPVTAPIWPGT